MTAPMTRHSIAQAPAARLVDAIWAWVQRRPAVNGWCAWVGCLPTGEIVLFARLNLVAAATADGEPQLFAVTVSFSLRQGDVPRAVKRWISRVLKEKCLHQAARLGLELEGF